jgi:hypothetical protein
MGYHVKLVDGHVSRLYPCDYLSITIYDPETVRVMALHGKQMNVGVEIELCVEGMPKRVLRIPEDGETFYIENAFGKTIDHYGREKYDPEYAAEHRTTGAAEGGR